MCAYVKSYDGETKWIYFSIEDDELLERCNNIWKRFQFSYPSFRIDKEKLHFIMSHLPHLNLHFLINPWPHIC